MQLNEWLAIYNIPEDSSQDFIEKVLFNMVDIFKGDSSSDFIQQQKNYMLSIETDISSINEKLKEL